jgi:hypothetical protein
MAKKTYRLLQYEKFFSTENLAAYPHLNKLLSRYDNRMRQYLMAVIALIIHKTSYSHGFLSERYLAKKITVSESSANKILNYFCALGILNKHHRGYDSKLVDPIYDDRSAAITYTIISLQQLRLKKVDKRAEKILDSGLSLNAISWESIKNTFGEQEANRIYRESHRQQSLTPSLFEQEFIAALNRLTAEKQWTTKSAVIDEVCCKLEKSERTIDSRFREFQPRLNDLGYTWKRISQADVEATGIALPIGRYAIFRNLIAPSQASVSVCTEAERRHY